MAREIGIYTAGAQGFDDFGREALNTMIIPVMEELQYKIYNPWLLTDAKKVQRATQMKYGLRRKRAWDKLNDEIFSNNEAAIRKSHGLLVILDGGGLDPDSGTSWEMGFGYALGKKLLGLRTDFRLAGDNDGCMVNIMIERSILRSGGMICTDRHNLPSCALALFGDPRI